MQKRLRQIVHDATPSRLRPRGGAAGPAQPRARVAVAAAAGALALLCALALAPAAGAQPKSFYGVVVPGSDSIASTGGSLDAQDYARMRAGGVGTLRFKASWRVIEPSPGDFNWFGLDRIIGNAAAHGVRSLPVMNLPPGHVRTPPTRGSDRQAFRRLMAELAGRYGPGGTFWQGTYQDRFPGSPVVPVTSWQLFNEQNARHHWQGRPSPRSYGKIVKAGAGGVRSQHRRAEIILGGMFGTPGGRNGMFSWRFLAKLYGVKGIKRAFDTVAVHPYAPNLRGLRQQMNRIRRVMVRNRDRRAKTRVTELGWGAARRGHPQNVGPKGQRRMLSKAFGLLARQRGAKRWNVAGVNWYSWHDGGAECGFCATSGLFRGPLGSRKPRPAWRAFRSLAR